MIRIDDIDAMRARFLTDLQAQRQKFLDGLDANEGDINLDIFEDFYPDQAHFLFELLQNAEDARATDVNFELKADGCIFEHNGKKRFKKRNVRAITGIHNSSKTGASEEIGKFGVGFKSVFVYSLTPTIYSAQYSFKISRLVLPENVSPLTNIGNSTRFELPFNNPKKSPQVAFDEIQDGLKKVADTTLLFLSHLKSIRWRIGDTYGEVLRVTHRENHIEVLKRTEGEDALSSHFLRFTQPVRGIEKQHIAVAFPLDQLPKVQTYDPAIALAKQFRIITASPGRVAVYFPAEKETSGLRFHIHAPFVPELSRASVKDTPANTPLFLQLAELCASALHLIRDLGLLTAEFLAVLPNPHDTLPSRYYPIREAIQAEMNNKPLTPTQARTHAPAKNLLQAKAALKELLSPEDLEVLVDYVDEPPQWAISAAQKNSNADRFLAGLEVQNWDVEEFVERFTRLQGDTASWYFDRDLAVWLASKPLDWHQQFYALLYHEFSAEEDWGNLRSQRIIRLSDGTYDHGKRCFFPSEAIKQDELLPRVSEAVYTSGKRKIQREAARNLLEALGVREVGEVEQVQSILDQRYTKEAFKPNLIDIKRFMALVEKEPVQSKIFAKYLIFKRADGNWSTPGMVYVDSPFFDTGLIAYYKNFGAKDVSALAESYTELKISLERLRKFAEAVGAITHLELTPVNCWDNPQWCHLSAVGGERNTSPINQDFSITGLAQLLSRPNIELSKLVWRTMSNLPRHSRYLVAKFQRNSKHGFRTVDSQLIHVLSESAWVPQSEGRFVRPAEASSVELPDGFAFDLGHEWIKKVKFGEINRQRVEQSAKRETEAKALGFSDIQSLERAKKFAALPADEQERFLEDFERRQSPAFPDHEPSNPGRRSERVGNQAKDAPDRVIEQRMRSVSVEREAVKEQTLAYLQGQYTSSSGEMFCQACKSVMPFKLDDGNYYFEMVEFLTKLKKRHYQNYLALCPNHAAMFRHANASKDLMQSMFGDISSEELEVLLAQEEITIRFTKTHIADIKSIIEADG